jgi:excisionase family DNA binding protein
MGQGMEEGSGGSGGMATEMAVGLAIAQQMIRQEGGNMFGTPGTTPSAGVGAATLPELLSVDQVAQVLGVSGADVLSIIGSGELAAKKIGETYRIKRSALDAFLAD